MKHLSLITSALLSLSVFANDQAPISATSSTPLPSETHTFSQQWGFDAIKIPQSISGHSAESLGLLPPTNLQSTNSQFASREGSWIPMTIGKGRYWLGAIKQAPVEPATTLTLKQHTAKSLDGLNAGFVSERFSAETAFIKSHDESVGSSTFYIQGAYHIFARESLTVSLTAKIETIGDGDILNYFTTSPYNLTNNTFYKEKAKNTTLGIVTSYSISKNWKVLGIISSTNLDNKLEQSPLLKTDNVHVAAIGTSYSF